MASITSASLADKLPLVKSTNPSTPMERNTV